MKSKVVQISAAKMKGYNAAEERDKNVVGRRIAEARKRGGLTLTAFAEHLESLGVNVTRTAASKWETGETVPNAYQMIAIFSSLGIEDSISSLIGDYTPPMNEAGMKKVEEYKADLIASGKYRPVPKVLSSIRYIDMPVSNLAVSAGTGAFLDEDSFEMVSFPESTVPDGADFGVRVSGDSMEPVYHDGQIVWVRRCEELNLGEVGIFICDGEGFLKAYGEQEPDPEMADEYTDSYGVVHPQPVLISFNQAYSPKVVRCGSELQIVGKVL